MSKPIKNYILLVDSYRRPSRCRNTRGRYRVGAKTPDEAVKLLRAVIGFGSIRVYYEVDPRMHEYDGPPVGYKTVVQQIATHNSNSRVLFKYVEPHHASDPHETYVDRIRVQGARLIDG